MTVSDAHPLYYAGVLLGLVAIVIVGMVERLLRARVELHRLQFKRAAAEETSRLKGVFLAHMSHELRTPLNAIIGLSNVLLKRKGEPLGEQEITFVSRIAANGTHLLRLIDDVLEMSRIEAGALELQVTAVDLAALVREILAEHRTVADARDVRLKADLPPHLVPLETDRARLRQILVNLVSNAVKFTRGADVTVRVHADPDTGDAARIDVIDFGIGIPADRLLVIFEAFQQVDTSNAREYGGTGLGLAITRSLAKSLGWRLDVTSTPGVGSTFSVVMERSKSRVRCA